MGEQAFAQARPVEAVLILQCKACSFTVYAGILRKVTPSMRTLNLARATFCSGTAQPVRAGRTRLVPRHAIHHSS
eukprot:6212267-Pleurochrysis_carterae.AAC.1